jgi:hypothetical protein
MRRPSEAPPTLRFYVALFIGEKLIIIIIIIIIFIFIFFAI